MLIDPADVAIRLEDGDVGEGVAAPTSAPIVQTSLFTFPDFQSMVDALAAEHRRDSDSPSGRREGRGGRGGGAVSDGGGTAAQLALYSQVRRIG